MNEIASALVFLRAAQNPDGGWPYLPGGESSPEVTCHAALACALGGEAGAARAALDWLTQRVGTDGALRLPGATEAHWTTSLTLYLFARLAHAPDVQARLAARLLEWRVQRSDSDAMVRLNAHLVGWSWNEGTFSWVEPTAYAILALKDAGWGNHARVLEGTTLLLDRACAGGGWNYGNPEVMQRQLPAFPDPTAWALLALQGSHIPGGVVQAGLDFLAREVPRYPSALALALGSLALQAFNRPVESLLFALRARQQADGSWRRRVHSTALAALALIAGEGGAHGFRL